tara:strand:+ start:2801 stop:3799 length:999 start_codon:yes stop_codon:yes gene_type:complete
MYIRKAPQESATQFSVGTTKTGNDGNMWVIVKNRNDVNRWVKKNSLFVLYSFNNVESWEYKNIPNDWEWVGSGSAIGYPYEKEEQFSGPPNSKTKTKTYLNMFFANLKKKQVIKKYKIIENYSPKKSKKKSAKKARKSTKKSRKSTKKSSKLLAGKKYLIFDNGGRPFKVVIKGNDLDIFTYADENGQNDYSILIKSYRKLNKIFVPKGIDDRGNSWSKGKGNTILAHISGNRYLFIGPWIYEFETKGKILEYHSQVGNSGVPYPLAVGENNVYFLIEKGEGYLSKEYFEEFPKKYNWAIDGYSRLWGQNMFDKKLSTKKISKIKVIAKRKW